MSTPRSSLRGALAPALVAAAVAFGAAGASADPNASASARPAASGAEPVEAFVSGARIPSEPAAPPSADEWTSAVSVRPQRGDPGGCSLLLVREWLKVRCPETSGAGLVAGDPNGVSVQAFGTPEGPVPLATRVVLPLRRDEAKLVTFVREHWEFYAASTFTAAGTLSVVWRKGRPDPVLAMHGMWKPAPR